MEPPDQLMRQHYEQCTERHQGVRHCPGVLGQFLDGLTPGVSVQICAVESLLPLSRLPPMQLPAYLLLATVRSGSRECPSTASAARLHARVASKGRFMQDRELRLLQKHSSILSIKGLTAI